MQKIVIGTIIALCVICIPSVRRKVFSPFVLRVIRSFFLTLFVCAILAGVGYAGWYLWREHERQVGSYWTDETIHQEENPNTPGAGGPRKVIIQ